MKPLPKGGKASQARKREPGDLPGDFREGRAMNLFSDAERAAVYQAIYSRRDIRRFRSEPVPAATLLRVLEAAHHGPSVGFMQPWNFVVIRDGGVRSQVKLLFERERQAAACFYDEPQ